jgi:hypothetical protein
MLKGRRAMYLWSILQQPEEELVKKVYNAQKMFPVKDDWINQIESDLEDLGIEFDENQIKNTKKAKFKQIVQEKMREASHSHLLQEKDHKLSKLDDLSSEYQMKDYIKTNRLTLLEKQLLFNLRTRMAPVKTNFKNKYGDNLSCLLCEKSEESQQHLLVCPELLPQSDVKYMDLFGSLDEQVKAAKHWSKVMLERRIKLKMKESSLQRSHVH